MKTPQAFYDFTLQFHQDIDLVYPNWASDTSGARHQFYEDFRQGFGDQAVRELDSFFAILLANDNIDLESFWFKESKADWVISSHGLQRLFQDFRAWVMSLEEAPHP